MGWAAIFGLVIQVIELILKLRQERQGPASSELADLIHFHQNDHVTLHAKLVEMRDRLAKEV